MHAGLLILLAVATLILALWLVAARRLRGADLRAFDVGSAGERFGLGAPPSPELTGVHATFERMERAWRDTPPRQRLARMRALMDGLFDGQAFDGRIEAVDAGGVAAEWVIAPGADERRRLLYIHGGAWMLGSPTSHRSLTTQLSARAGAAVLAIDYRLMPEHPRRAGIEDCRSAYRWMIDHGPAGARPAEALFVAGDSAGGNLTLSLLGWIRDQGLRAPDAAVAMSPATDATLGSPSLKANLHSDPMLGPMFGRLARVPRFLLLWGAWVQTRINPRDPLVSPVYGNLSGLPPTLVQASEAEMLLDDSRRYVRRAQAAGSPVRLQTWAHMVHVWQIFHADLPEARSALDEIGRFLRTAAPRARNTDDRR